MSPSPHRNGGAPRRSPSTVLGSSAGAPPGRHTGADQVAAALRNADNVTDGPPNSAAETADGQQGATHTDTTANDRADGAPTYATANDPADGNTNFPLTTSETMTHGHDSVPPMDQIANYRARLAAIRRNSGRHQHGLNSNPRPWRNNGPTASHIHHTTAWKTIAGLQYATFAVR